MRRVTLRALWSHKRRLVSTVVAVLLGVAFMSGTFVFADTLGHAIDDLSAEANEKVDARIQGEVLFSSDFGDERRLVDEALADEVAAVDGVAGAAPYVVAEGFGPTGRVLGADGEPVGGDHGTPTVLESWITDPAVNGYVLTEGSRPPEADDELVLDVGAAEEGGLSVGDTVTVTSQFGPTDYTLVGTFTFGERESLGGIVAADFTLAEAQRLAGAEGRVTSVIVAAEGAVSQTDLVERIRPVVPDGAEVITGEEATEQDADAAQEGLAFFSQVLSVFGAIALFVGTFLIANTFQVLVAQRTRELALLRAVGASRAQVLTSVLLEALVIGLVAGIAGVFGGVALAAGITALLDALGVDLPTTGLVVSPETVITGLVIGVVVTVLASIAPAVRATRVPPLAALRDVAVEAVHSSRIRIGLALLALLLGGFNVSQAWGADGDTDVVPTVGIGALLIIVGSIVLGPAVAGRLVRTVGAFLPRLRGLTGRLAVENAARSPKRTSATASALLIAVALVGFITVFAESAKQSVSSELDRGLDADLIVQPSAGAFGGFGGFTRDVAVAVADVDGVEAVATWGGEVAEVTYPDGDTAGTFLGAVDPEAFAQVAEPRMEVGELLDLEPGTVLVDRQIVEDNDLEVGDELHFVVPGGGELDLRVAGVSDDTTILGPWGVHVDDIAEVATQRLDLQVYATVEQGAEVAEVQAAVAAAIERFPDVEVLDRDGFIGDLANQLTAFVNVIYGLLALSIVIAMIGVANTLSLSVHERTREIGLLRAVGMARTQLRATIRWEAAVIAVLGTTAGLVLGLIASYGLVKALEGSGLTTFAVPVVTLLVQVAVAALFAVLASERTARRAAKLDVLQAIATE